MKRVRFTYKYTNITIFILVLLILFALGDTGIPNTVIDWIDGYGYIGAVVTGIFFVSLFTVVPASLILIALANEFDPLLIALGAGIGASIGDLVLFRFFREGLFDELRMIFRNSPLTRFTKIFKTRLFLWLTPLVGALIIASPFPDEVGIGLLGISKIQPWQFLMLSLILNSLGILAIISIF